jgi:hypothetical protein
MIFHIGRPDGSIVVRTAVAQCASSAAPSAAVRTGSATVQSVATVRKSSARLIRTGSSSEPRPQGVCSVVRTGPRYCSLSSDRPHLVRSMVRTDHVHCSSGRTTSRSGRWHFSAPINRADAIFSSFFDFLSFSRHFLSSLS